jgi:hypothetical protein
MLNRFWEAIAMLSALAVLGTACGSDTPTSPTTSNNLNLSGSWRGTANSTLHGVTAPIVMVVTQSGVSLSGTYTCSSVVCISSTGTISATVSGTNVRGTVTFPSGGGCNTFNGTVSSTRFTGNYSCQTSFSSDQGTLSLTK